MNDEPAGQPAAGSLLSKDTFADKTVRFGCGAVLAVLVFVSLALSGVGEAFGMSGLVTGGVVLVATSGVLSVTHGERFLERLLKLIRWLA